MNSSYSLDAYVLISICAVRIITNVMHDVMLKNRRYFKLRGGKPYHVHRNETCQKFSLTKLSPSLAGILRRRPLPLDLSTRDFSTLSRRSSIVGEEHHPRLIYPGE